MILGNLAIFLNALTVLLISALVIILISAFLIAPLNKYLNRLRTSPRIFLLWCLVLSPWLIGLVAAFIAIGPSALAFELPLIDDYVRWHHPTLFTLGDWHGVFLGFALLAGVFLTVKFLYRLATNSRQVKMLLAFSHPCLDDIHQLDTALPAAFTAGILKPVIFISAALRQALSDKEYQVVKLHEQAHISHCHLPKKWLFMLLTLIFPRPVSLWLKKMMDISFELQADTTVNRDVSDKAFIAETLLKVKSLVSSVESLSFQKMLGCHFGIDAIEQRISYLLTPPASNTARFFTSLIFIIPMAIAAAVFGAFFSDLAHHAIELLLNH